MRVGVVFPQTEIGNDPARIKEFAQAAEDLGYTHLVPYDHVLGAVPTGRRPGWRPIYTNLSPFHEPFVLLAFLAAVTKRIELAPGVIVLPQRQTALVAKQAAALDVLSGGRLRLGVGIGWNDVEFEALGMDFHDRGKRIEEQIALLRSLWTSEVVDFVGRWHRVDRAALNPLPLQRPIPLWMGADAKVAVKRVARLADGWFSHLPPDDEGRAGIERFREYVRAAGRDPGKVGVEGRVYAARGGPDEWSRAAEVFRDMGCTHLEFNVGGEKYTSLEERIGIMRAFREMMAPLFA